MITLVQNKGFNCSGSFRIKCAQQPYLYNFFSSLVLRWTWSSSYLVMECRLASSLLRLDSEVSKQGMSMACRMLPIPSASFLEPSLAALLAFSRLDVTRSGH